MPPLKGIDRGLNGEALKGLEEIGHGSQIAIVDPSYPIPEGARVIPYMGESSASALKGVLALVPHEPDGAYDVICMDSTDGSDTEAYDAFSKVTDEIGLKLGCQNRFASPLDPEMDPGFYADTGDPERRTLYLRTRDTKAFACARFTVGHSQE
jgi:L-fucose mutarotase/ribose pyranase (RbsD/FucU family)